jgi:type II restriction enzyme
MKTYLTKSKKSKPVQRLINEALDILETVGIPFSTKSQRGLEKMAMSFLAVAGVKKSWSEAKTLLRAKELKSRDIITFINSNFEENISYGSYDDIRRKDLKLPLLAELILNSGDISGSSTNNPTRGYMLHPDFKELVTKYGTKDWYKKAEEFNSNRPNLTAILERKRNLKHIDVKLPGGKPLELSLGEHNQLQKEIIESFLPRYGSGCEVLYIGDASNKMLHIDQEGLKKINFFTLSHDELPDVIALDKTTNWLYLIEAVHSSGVISEVRRFELKKLLKNCTAELIFVTAFQNMSTYKKWAMEIAWETEVWIAERPDHLIHFNGHRFLGPYKG